MKKIVFFIFLLITFLTFSDAKAMTYEEAINQSKPIAIFIYADWADNIVPTQQAFNNAASKYGNKYNFVTLNIANPDTKVFNKTYHIYPNLPYVLLFKDRGRLSRYLQGNCVIDKDCFTSKLDVFAN